MSPKRYPTGHRHFGRFIPTSITDNMSAAVSAKTRQREACVSCRAVKVRCLDNDDKSQPCSRCRRLGITCTYHQQRRGRKRASGRESAGVPGSGTGRLRSDSAASEPSFRFQPYPQAAVMPEPQPTFDPAVFHTDNEVPALHTSQTITPNVAPLISPIPTSTPASVQSVRAGPSLDVTHYLHPQIVPGPPDSLGTPGPVRWLPAKRDNSSDEVRRSYEDPVSLHLLSQAEAETLVVLFHTHLNPMIALLDPHLHDISYLRNSPTLFTAVLAASSKFFRPDLQPTLLAHAQTLVNRAVAAGQSNCGIIQSLMILVYWKAPTDRSVWVKLGIAIRLAYQLGWHVRREGALPTNETDARELLNVERSWICLICFDRMYSDIFDLPSAINASHLPTNGEQWAREHAHLEVTIDSHLAYSLSTMPTYDAWHAFRNCKDVPKEYIQSFCTDQIAAYERTFVKWFSPNTNDEVIGKFQPAERDFLRWFSLTSLLDIKRTLWQVTPDPGFIRADCLRLCAEITGLVERVAQSGALRYLQDVGSCSLSQVGLFLYNAFRSMTFSQREMSIGFLKRLHTVTLRAAEGDSEAATAFVARFLQRVLRQISSESRAITRHPSPSGIEPGPAEPDKIITELDDFLRANQVLPDLANLDEQYWSSFFTSIQTPLFEGQL